MADDQKLVEAVARALDPTAWIPAKADTETVKFCRRSHRRVAAKRKAHAIIAAINASGTHWVAPVFPSIDGGFTATQIEEIRTAYLAKTEGTKLA